LQASGSRRTKNPSERDSAAIQNPYSKDKTDIDRRRKEPTMRTFVAAALAAAVFVAAAALLGTSAFAQDRSLTTLVETKGEPVLITFDVHVIEQHWDRGPVKGRALMSPFNTTELAVAHLTAFAGRAVPLLVGPDQKHPKLRGSLTPYVSKTGKIIVNYDLHAADSDAAGTVVGDSGMIHVVEMPSVNGLLDLRIEIAPILMQRAQPLDRLE
jgi:hypothetical protein